MNAVVYLFQVSACMGIFYLFYYLLLSRYTFFTINRWYLIITLAISFIIPLLTITVQQQETYPQVIKQVVYINQMQTPQQVVITDNAPAHVQINWMALVRLIYMVAVAGLLIRLLLIVVRFFTRIKNRKKTKIGGILIVKGDEELRNGSFFNYIFLNDDELSADELEQIIAHEMLHVKLYHSVDRMLVKIAQVFLWFNPFVYLYARAIEENHEFEVDRSVSNSTDRNKYAELLFHLSVAKQGTLYHNFSMVPLKKRITMLFTKPTNRMKKIIYLLTVPVVLISCLAFAKLKNDDSAKTKKLTTSTLRDSTKKYRQKIKHTIAQARAIADAEKEYKAFKQTVEYKDKQALASKIGGQTIIAKVEGVEVKALDKTQIRGFILNYDGQKLLLITSYGQEKQLNNLIRTGDVLTIKVFGSTVTQGEPVGVMPASVANSGKKIFQLAEAGKIPDYPFLYEANKVRFADGQVSNITKYANGKWKAAVFERVNGYKFNLSFKPDAPNLNNIKDGDHVRLRFVHEVKTGDKTYKINDWVAISTDIRGYGIKNPEWFGKFYEVVNEKQRTGAIKTTDTVRVSALRGAGVEALGVKPLVLIDGVEYSKDILYKISQRGLKGTTVYYPNNGDTKYGEKAKDGAMIIETKNGVITYLADIERENNLKIRAAKEKFFSRITLTKDDGSKYDLATISRKSGTVITADVPTNGKIAFIINNEVYNEADFKRLFPVDNASYGPAGGVYMGTKELSARGFKLEGYDVVFLFDSNAGLKTINAPVKTGAIVPGINNPVYRSWSTGKGTTGRPVLITGGSSDFRGSKMTAGFTLGGSGSYKKSYASSVFSPYFHSNNTGTAKDGEDTKKSSEDIVPNAKDTVGTNLGGKMLKQTLAMLPGVEIRSDGSLWVNNQPVKRALINGKEYMGGGASQAVNALPAEIINKIKVTNNPAANGSSKPENILNISTKPDKPQNKDLKKDLLNSIPTIKAGYKNLNDSLVAARFAGEVITVKDILDTRLVIIKNGEYFAAYSNLKNVKVLKGQEVKRGQILGVAAFNPDENKVAARMELYRGQHLITDKTEQEALLKNFESPKLNMLPNLKLKDYYAYNL